MIKAGVPYSQLGWCPASTHLHTPAGVDAQHQALVGLRHLKGHPSPSIKRARDVLLRVQVQHSHPAEPLQLPPVDAAALGDTLRIAEACRGSHRVRIRPTMKSRYEPRRLRDVGGSNGRWRALPAGRFYAYEFRARSGFAGGADD